ncbi:uncharacterized protein L969DRAFT_18431 [Mixia osmundae IAM 14324]|uniref:Uncharacterized protein n=1 Tax=Mixia osmundae (strain CBS 9802 / IAM 14324 / JCM 22182 / KY 12970) TaxID=764103 RepID=G7E7K4_MIXOS|nr:uncharacterized protein L969DRAFT_18431 [Mixia osmundae IAM 14324]KEI38417.1 hypothetical protein L969DRAFT_18431 [Mixia osmundae IAM 14324]GAA98814.1 hypothetical protein E5Q_05502 [Mixia osmundae IAM 14324]
MAALPMSSPQGSVASGALQTAHEREPLSASHQIPLGNFDQLMPDFEPFDAKPLKLSMPGVYASDHSTADAIKAREIGQSDVRSRSISSTPSVPERSHSRLPLSRSQPAGLVVTTSTPPQPEGGARPTSAMNDHAIRDYDPRPQTSHSTPLAPTSNGQSLQYQSRHHATSLSSQIPFPSGQALRGHIVRPHSVAVDVDLTKLRIQDAGYHPYRRGAPGARGSGHPDSPLASPDRTQLRKITATAPLLTSQTSPGGTSPSRQTSSAPRPSIDTSALMLQSTRPASISTASIETPNMSYPSALSDRSGRSTPTAAERDIMTPTPPGGSRSASAPSPEYFSATESSAQGSQGYAGITDSVSRGSSDTPPGPSISTDHPSIVSYATPRDPTRQPVQPRGKLGLKGLRKALNRSATPVTDHESHSSETPSSSGVQSTSSSGYSSRSTSPPSTPPSGYDLLSELDSAVPGQATHLNGKQSGRRSSIFNSRLGNASTDNISISSTMSSASMIMRKIGGFGGKLTKRHSISGLTHIFRDKSRSEPAVSFDAPRSDKGKTTAARVAHVTVEQDGNVASPSRAGMTPAEALVKQHQLEYAQRQAAADAAAGSSKLRQLAPPTDRRIEMLEREKMRAREQRKGRKWGLDLLSKNNTSRSSLVPGPEPITDRQAYDSPLAGPSTERYMQPSKQASPSLDDSPASPPMEMPRAKHRDYQGPIKGILKAHPTDRQDMTIRGIRALRDRSHSYDSPHQKSPPNRPGTGAALVQIIPSEQQIDGIISDGTGSTHRRDTIAPSSVESGGHMPYMHASHNVSAPALSKTWSATPPTLAEALTRRPASMLPSDHASLRRLHFAPNLSVHTTWPAEVYDRRGEPATCNRLTPTLAQRIKEELNAYKMEEMSVHPTSRVYTHFFL